MKIHDPNGIFLNKFSQRLLGISSGFSEVSEFKHCALSDFCICKNNTDCGNQQTCSKVSLEINGENATFKVCSDTTNFLRSISKAAQPMPVSALIKNLSKLKNKDISD